MVLLGQIVSVNNHIVMPADKSMDIEAAMAASLWHIPPLMAEIACQWMEDGTATRVITIKRQEAARRIALLKKHLPASDLQLRAGGLHLWLHLPETWQGEDFAQQAAKEGVLVIPSVNFFPGPHPEQQAIRICIGPPKSDDELIHGAVLLKELLQKKPAARAAII